MRVSVVPLSAASLNSGDVFILDLGLTLYQWNGSEANRKEKSKALEVCTGLKDDERGGKARIKVCDQGSEPAAFWEGIGGRGAVAPAVEDTAPAGLTKKGVAKLIEVRSSPGLAMRRGAALAIPKSASTHECLATRGFLCR